MAAHPAERNAADAWLSTQDANKLWEEIGQTLTPPSGTESNGKAKQTKPAEPSTFWLAHLSAEDAENIVGRPSSTSHRVSDTINPFIVEASDEAPGII
jgi:hypothetical protein